MDCDESLGVSDCNLDAGKFFGGVGCGLRNSELDIAGL